MEFFYFLFFLGEITLKYDNSHIVTTKYDGSQPESKNFKKSK